MTDSDQDPLRLTCLQLAITSSPVAPGSSLLIHILLKRAEAFEKYVLEGEIPPKETLVAAPAGRA